MVIVEQKINIKLKAKYTHLHSSFKVLRNKILYKIAHNHTEKEMQNIQNMINKKAPKLLKEIEVQTCQEILQ